MGKGGAGMNWKTGIGIYTLIDTVYKMDNC